MMMELFLMALVIPMFGIFGGLMGGMVKTFGLDKMAKKGDIPLLPPPVGGILPTVAYLFQRKVKAKQKQTQQGGSTPPSSGDTDSSVGFLRRLLQTQSDSPSWVERQLFGRDPSRRMEDEGGFWSAILEEALRRQKGGQ